MKYDLSVALGILTRGNSILISRRMQSDTLGGAWELPGGKKEPGETTFETLRRELKEEIGISVLSARPLISTTRTLKDYHLNLAVFEVLNWSGFPEGKEGQDIKWIRKDKLIDYSFPRYNDPIRTAITLPSLACVTPPLTGGEDEYIESILKILKSGVKLVQLRPQTAKYNLTKNIALRLHEQIRALEAILMLNGKVSQFESSIFQGLHLNRVEASKYFERPISKKHLLSTSCHNLEELKHAIKIEVDFAYISPVKRTNSHPDSPSLGWEGLRKMVQRSSIPVFALGGLSDLDIISAREIGCQGIAMQSALWNHANQKEYMREIYNSLRYLDST